MWYEFECMKRDGGIAKILYGETDDPATAGKVLERLNEPPRWDGQTWVKSEMESPPTQDQLQWENQDSVGDLGEWLEAEAQVTGQQ